MNTELRAILERRLDDDPSLDTGAGLLVLAACEGTDALSGALTGQTPPASTGVANGAAADTEPAGAYLSSVTVSGFRGIGPGATLELTPGPGLTLVVGRNGSGKSSFVEGLEVLLTGDSFRWSDRKSTAWREEWRNLHHSTASVEATFAVEGNGAVTARRAWDNDAGFGDGTTAILNGSRAGTSFETLGWTEALAAYRPLLSYNELGSMLDAEPSKLHDSLSAILGLGDLDEARRALQVCRSEREKAKRGAINEGKQTILPLLGSIDDDRARICAGALSAKSPTVAHIQQVEAAIGTGAGHESGDAIVARLRALAAVTVPGQAVVVAAVDDLRSASAAATALRDTDGERALQTAELLRRALLYHENHGDSSCPVCGAGGLDAAWRRQTEVEAARLEAEGKDARATRQRLQAARQAARRLLVVPPESLGSAGDVGLDPAGLTGAWAAFVAAPAADGDSADLADHIDSTYPALREAWEAFVGHARQLIDEREDAWRPVARQLAGWVGPARRTIEEAEHVPVLRKAERWLTGAIDEIRAERFTPIAEQAQAIWERFRQGNTVELGRVALEGSATRRHVKLEVTVDGAAGGALGVLSQGELHALALSLFIPRATLPESPFRMLVIDDPVQAMDPARVDGLARVLDEVAKRRQVIVFSHDERLPESVRRLGIDAHHLQVQRSPGSVVVVEPLRSPVERYLSDARAVLLEKEVPEDVARRVLPGFCRAAIEAACNQVVRTRRLTRGDPHTDVDDAVESVRTLTQRVALAVFDDPGQADKLYARLNRAPGPDSVDALIACSKGAHEPQDMAPQRMLDATRTLTNYLAQLRA